MNGMERTGKSQEFTLAQALAEAAVVDCVASLQVEWVESLAAEQAGDITKALEHHDHILDEVGRSYVAYLRAGWLHYRAGGYNKAIEFYEKAARRSPGSVAPLFGAMGCHVAMGDAHNASKLVQTILSLEEMDDEPPSLLATYHASNNFYSLPAFLDPPSEQVYSQGQLLVSGAA